MTIVVGSLEDLVSLVLNYRKGNWGTKNFWIKQDGYQVTVESELSMTNILFARFSCLRRDESRNQSSIH